MMQQVTEQGGIRLAIEGCGHGVLHSIYASIRESCKQRGWPGVDLVIIGGDFQAARNGYDLNCINMPAKYRSMCDFHEYYSGQKTAPYLTIFVGGNHEASNHLFELYYGGWVAPNIYYMGAANLLHFGPLRIAGMSGIWKGYNYRRPHHERLPYNESDMRSVYHVRELDVRKLLQIRTQVDIGVSHDWPKGVEWKGNWKQLFKFKKHLEEDARNGQLGSVAAKYVMDWLRPSLWFSAHLHCKYAAVVSHGGEEVAQQPLPAADENGITAQNGDEIDLEAAMEGEINSGTDQPTENKAINGDEIELDLDDDIDAAAPETSQTLSAAPPQNRPAQSAVNAEARAALPESFRRPANPETVEHPPAVSNKTTSFLALDKCLEGKHFLQLMAVPTDKDIDDKRPLKLQYDREWLAITRGFAVDEPLVLGNPDAVVPHAKPHAEYGEAILKHRAWIDEHLNDAHLIVPQDFELTAPIWDGRDWNLPEYSLASEHPSPQTDRFCQMLDIPNPFKISDEEKSRRMAAGPQPDPFDHSANSAPRGGFGRGRGRGGGRGRGRGGGRPRGFYKGH